MRLCVNSGLGLPEPGGAGRRVRAANLISGGTAEERGAEPFPPLARRLGGDSRQAAVCRGGYRRHGPAPPPTPAADEKKKWLHVQPPNQAWQKQHIYHSFPLFLCPSCPQPPSLIVLHPSSICFLPPHKSTSCPTLNHMFAPVYSPVVPVLALLPRKVMGGVN